MHASPHGAAGDPLRKRLFLHGLSIASGVAVALLGVAVLRGGLFAPSAPPGYLSARAEGYTVYAPSQLALMDAVNEVKSARETFRASFASAPVDVVVVVADSPAAFRSMDLGALRRRGAAFLAYVTREYIALPPGGDELVSLDDAVILEPAGDTLRVAASGYGGARDAGLRLGDELLSLNGVRASTPDSLRHRFEVIPFGAPVRLQVRRRSAVLHLSYPKGRVIPEAAQAHAAASGKLRAETHSLAHEVCHQLIAARAGRPRVRHPSGGRYGSPGLPDWLDETAAVFCESPASRDRRREYVRKNLGTHIPFAVFASMDHPLMTALSVRGPGHRLPDTADAPVIMLNREEARALLRNLNAPLFYAQALSVGEFILDRGGPRTLQRLTDELADGRTLEHALSRASRDAPALPATLSGLEDEWVRWMRVRGGS